MVNAQVNKGRPSLARIVVLLRFIPMANGNKRRLLSLQHSLSRQWSALDTGCKDRGCCASQEKESALQGWTLSYLA